MSKRTKSLSEEEFELYFKRWQNADKFVCACGCGVEFEVHHPMASRIKFDLGEMFK